MTEMNSLTLNGKTYDCFVDGVARASVVIGSASGDSITVNDSSEQPLVGFNIYGKSTQAGTPTPDAPIDIKSIGDDGDVGINVGSDRFVLMTGDGLRGVQVTDKSLATYTEANGKMWCADEIDFERGVAIQRINRIVLTGTEGFNASTVAQSANYYRYALTLASKYYSNVPNGKVFDGYCSHYTRVSADAGYGGSGANGVALKTETLHFYVAHDTVDKFKAFLVEQYFRGTPVIVCYRVATPIETPLTDDQIAVYKAMHTSKPNTTITNGENAYMSVKYIADAKAYIDNKVSGIIAATVE